MIIKIKANEAEKFSKLINLNSYFTNPYWLSYNGFYEIVNGERVFYERDVLYRNDFPFIKLPRNKNNWINAIITNITKKEMESIKKYLEIKSAFVFGSEYYYKTRDFIEMKGKKFKSFRKAVNQFKKRYKFRIKKTYSGRKLIEFLKKWESQQKEKNELFVVNKNFELFCIKNCKNIKGNWLFVEVDGKLAGYCLYYKANRNLWIGIQRKVDYKYNGLSRFMMHEQARIMKNVPVFTSGSAARDKGIKEFKESLNPYMSEDRYYIITGNKKR